MYQDFELRTELTLWLFVLTLFYTSFQKYNHYINNSPLVNLRSTCLQSNKTGIKVHVEIICVLNLVPDVVALANYFPKEEPGYHLPAHNRTDDQLLQKDKHLIGFCLYCIFLNKYRI